MRDLSKVTQLESNGAGKEPGDPPPEPACLQVKHF